MDPNRNVFSSFSAGPGGNTPNRKAIVSTPDIAVPLAVQEETPARATSMQPAGPIMSSPDSEDIPAPRGGIVLGGGPKNNQNSLMALLRGRKTLIIAGIILVVLALIFAVAAVILNSRGTGNGSSLASEAKIVFNKYANFVYYGEASSEDFTFPTDSTFTPFIKTITVQENKEVLLNELNSYYNGFYSTYKKMLGENTEIPTAVAEYNQAFQFYMIWAKNELPSRDELAVKYVKNGKNSVENELKTLANKYSSFTDIFGYKYYELMTNWSNSTVELIEKYSEAGCVNESGIDYKCVFEAYGGTLDGIMSQINVISTDINLAQKSVIAELTFNLATLKNQLANSQMEN